MSSIRDSLYMYTVHCIYHSLGIQSREFHPFRSKKIQFPLQGSTYIVTCTCMIHVMNEKKAHFVQLILIVGKEAIEGVELILYVPNPVKLKELPEGRKEGGR